MCNLARPIYKPNVAQIARRICRLFSVIFNTVSFHSIEAQQTKAYLKDQYTIVPDEL